MTPTPYVRIELSPKTKKLFKKFERSAGREQVYGVVQKYFDREAVKAGAQIGAEILRGKFPGDENGRGGLRNRTGTLARSIIGRGLRIDGVPAIKVGVLRGPAVRYAGVQEQGTKGYNKDSPYDTIVPKRAKALAIPMGEALTPSGVAKYRSPRQFPEELTFIPSRKGRTVGWLYKASDLKKVSEGTATMKDIQPQYRLASAVDIPPKFFLRDGLTVRLPGIANGLASVLVASFDPEKS